jgi:magnesium-transporting ATPase (P-type)
VNTVTSAAIGLPISFAPRESDVVIRPSPETGRSILDGFGLWRVALVGLCLRTLTLTLAASLGMKSKGADDALARTAAVAALTVGWVFFLLKSRFTSDYAVPLSAHSGNRYLPVALGAVIVAFVGCTSASRHSGLPRRDGVQLAFL